MHMVTLVSSGIELRFVFLFRGPTDVLQTLVLLYLNSWHCMKLPCVNSLNIWISGMYLWAKPLPSSPGCCEYDHV